VVPFLARTSLKIDIRVLFTKGQCGRGVNPNTNVRLIPRLIILEQIIHLSHTPSWYAQKHLQVDNPNEKGIY
jgi:hypothetical protein